jgi:hypothetical protein
MFVGSFFLFVVILHFIFKKSLGLGGWPGVTLAVVFFFIVYSMSKDAAVAAGAAAAFAAYTI